MIIAWRILYLTMIARESPNANCEIAFTEEEWKVAYTVFYRRKPPDKPIDLSSMLNLIAQLSGYLNRKNDKNPGPTSIWIGLQRLKNFITATEAYNALLNYKTYG
jgi:hypothetical protein